MGFSCRVLPESPNMCRTGQYVRTLIKLLLMRKCKRCKDCPEIHRNPLANQLHEISKIKVYVYATGQEFINFTTCS